MKKQRITAVMTALVLGVSSLSAFAQPGPRGPQGPEHGPQKKAPKRPAARTARAPPPSPTLSGAASAPRPPTWHASRAGQTPWGLRTRSQLGEGLRACRRNTARISTWSMIGTDMGSSAHPRGYHWVQYGSDYLLVAIATGVIAQLILGN